MPLAPVKTDSVCSTIDNLAAFPTDADIVCPFPATETDYARTGAEGIARRPESLPAEGAAVRSFTSILRLLNSQGW